MKFCRRWMYVAVAVAATAMAVTAIVQSVRQGSWSPVFSVGWLVAVLIAVSSPRGTRRCLPLRRRAR